MNNQFYYGFFDELEKEAFASPAVQRLAGGGVGAGVGALSTQRKPGESNSDYAKRTALAAGIGGAIGVGGVQAARAGYNKMRANRIAEIRSDAAGKAGTIAGLGSLGVALAGRNTDTGKAIKGVQNVLQSDAAAKAIKGGKGSTDEVLGELGKKVQENEGQFVNFFSNMRKRKKYKKGVADINANSTLNDAQKKQKIKDLRKSMGMVGKDSSLKDDALNLFSGNRVQMSKTPEMMQYDSVRTKVMKDLFDGAGGAKSSDRVFGKMKDKAFVGRGGAALSAADLEKRLNRALTRIEDSDVLSGEQKSKMLANVKQTFEKRFKVSVDDTGNMSGRTYADRFKRFGKGLIGDKNKYTIRSRKKEGLMPRFFAGGEKIAHIADDILNRHGY